MRSRGKVARFRLWPFAFVATILIVAAFYRFKGCRHAPRMPKPNDPSLVLVTGYCNCGDCCGWKRSWFGFGSPVYAYGPMKGKPKRVGITASGKIARHGTIAADPQVWPFGTKLRVPGWGDGVVEDIGGSIKGRHIDLWFPSHLEARRWGSRWLKVEKVK